MGGSLILARLAQYVIEQPTLDLLIVGRFGSPADAGAYYAAAKVGSIIGVSLFSVTVVMGPVLSELATRGEQARLRSSYAWSSVLMAALGSFMGFGVLALRGEILDLFGSGYVRAESVLVVFAIAHVVVSLVGPNTPLLLATGRVRIEVRLTLVFAAGMLVFGVLLGALLGPFGVAISSGLWIAALGLMRYTICVRMFSAPSAIGNLPLAAFGLLAGAAAEVLRRAVPLDGSLRTIIVAVVYCLLFLVLSYPRLRWLRESQFRLASR